MSINADGRYVASKRDPAPWSHLTPSPISLEWHHIIPYARLRDCWEALSANRQLGKCRIALESFMRLLRVDAPRACLNAIREGTLSLVEQLEIERKLTWPSWNIIEGPKFRTDNPGDRLDFFTSGLTPTEAERQYRIRELYEIVKGFNPASAGCVMPERSALAVLTVMNSVERTLLAGE